MELLSEATEWLKPYSGVWGFLKAWSQLPSKSTEAKKLNGNQGGQGWEEAIIKRWAIEKITTIKNLKLAHWPIKWSPLETLPHSLCTYWAKWERQAELTPSTALLAQRWGRGRPGKVPPFGSHLQVKLTGTRHGEKGCIRLNHINLPHL